MQHFCHSIQAVLVGALLTIGASAVDHKPASNDAAAPSVDPDEKLLHDARISADEAGLANFLKEPAKHDEDLLQMTNLVGQLGSPNFREREGASKKLVDIGAAAIHPLGKICRQDDAEVTRRAHECLDTIRSQDRRPLYAAAVRLTIRTKAPTAIDSLLRYLPYAADEQVFEDIAFAIDSLALANGKIHAALLAALNDPIAERRAISACVVGHRGDKADGAKVRRLLEDPVPMVRLRAAQGILAAKDEAVLPSLIALLDQPAVEVSWQAEELLHWAAGDTSPAATVGSGSLDSRKKCQAAWETWYRTNGSKLNLATLENESRRPILLLICEADQQANEWKGRVWLCGCNGKPRWEVKSIGNPIYAGLMPDNAVLIGEQGRPMRAAVRDLEGKIQWQVDGGMFPLFGCNKVANGNVFLAFGSRAIEVNPSGEILHSWQNIQGGTDPHGCIVELGTSKVISVSTFGAAIKICDAFNGQPIREIPKGSDKSARWKTTLLGAGHLLAVVHSSKSAALPSSAKPDSPRGSGLANDEVLEFDTNGNIVWKSTLREAIAPVARLGNDNTLILRSFGLAEIDRAGRTVWEAYSGQPMSSAHLCLPLVALGFSQPRPASLDLDSLSKRLEALKKADPLARHASANALQFLLPHASRHSAEASIPTLAEALDDPCQSVSDDVSIALMSIGKASLPALIEVIRKDQLPASRAAAQALLSFGPEARQAVPVLIGVLGSKHVKLREDAATALGKIGPDSKGAVPKLITMLEEADEQLSLSAAGALHGIGAVAKEAIPALLGSARSNYMYVRVESILALAAIGNNNPSVGKALIELLDDKQYPDVPVAAAQALALFRPIPTEAVPKLIALVKGTDVKKSPFSVHVRTAAATSLSTMGEIAIPAIPDIIGLLKDHTLDSSARQSAAEALEHFGPLASQAVPSLTDALVGPDNQVGFAAGKALLRIGAEAKVALPRLRKVLSESTSVDIRQRVFIFLPDLEKATTSKKP
jgi:HEAT repeat protein